MTAENSQSTHSRPPWPWLVGCIVLGMVASTAWRLASGSGVPVHAREPQAAAPATETPALPLQVASAGPALATSRQASVISEVPEPTAAEKRMNRYDKDSNGTVSLEEYLATRRKSFDKLDTNHDGKLSFDEYTAKALMKFKAADANHDGKLSSVELETTAAKRKAHPRNCPPLVAAPADHAEDNQP